MAGKRKNPHRGTECPEKALQRGINVLRALCVSVVRFLFFVFWLLFGLDLSAQEAEVHEVIERVTAPYARLRTVRGHFVRTITFRGGEKEVVGRFVVRMPKELYVEYASPERQMIVSNGTVYWTVLPEAKRALRVEGSAMTEIERHLSTPASFLGWNVFEDMKQGFEWALSEHPDGHLILAATPLSGEVLSKVLVKVDPKHWVVLAREVFDTRGVLTSQTFFREVRTFEDSLCAPTKMETKSRIGEGEVLMERIVFSRLAFNFEVDDERFEFVPSSDVEVMSPGE